ncbi:MAG TPA: chemotaxis protein CheW [Bryobacteraceae bacterium]|nr:chemotaxis protein CheW [Bryobacteraceae bacterium]
MSETSQAAFISQMRDAFDGAFSHPEQIPRQKEFAIWIRVAGETFAVPMADIAGLLKSRKIVPFPARSSDVLGVISLRGSLAPVFDLAALLRMKSTAAPSWLILPCGEPLIALAFEAFEGRHEMNGTVAPQDTTGGERRQQLVQTAGGVRPLLDVPGLAAAIRKRAGAPKTGGEK